MSTTLGYNAENTNFYALLIGIDFYFPNPLYSSLGGCVRDISHVEDFLLHKVRGIVPRNILKFTSSLDRNNPNRPTESEDKLPTYMNMMKAFETVTSAASQGDQVYVHYAGHGGRVKTLVPNAKGVEGLDETLVPADIGDAGTRHLRDIEIAILLKRMLDKNLIVTLVLDSCHSGGLTRGRGGAVARGNNVEDKTPRPYDSLVASPDEMEKIWRSMTGTSMSESYAQNGRTRGLSASGWLPNPKGYVLLAACRPSESAFEYAFEGDERNGALTYWFLKSCEQMDKGLSFKVIHDRIVPMIHSQFPQQTPMLEGEGDRAVFGENGVQAIYAVSVMTVEASRKRILLNAGQAHGIRKGARFAVYPLGFSNFADIERRLCLAEIQERGATNSWAKIIVDFGRGNLEQGAQAVLINPVDIRLKRTVRLIDGNNFDEIKNRPLSSPDVPPIDVGHALDRLHEIIFRRSTDNQTSLELAKEGTEHADFQVAVSAGREYEIWDPAGKLIPHINPPLKIDEDKSASRIIERLEHLVKYSNVQLIDNLDADSEISRKLIAELFKAPDDYEPGDRPGDLQPPDVEGNTKLAKVGQNMVLQIRNTFPKESGKVINIAVLDLQPDWGISQVYPSSPGSNFIPIDPGLEEFFALNVSLPSGYSEGKDILKVFATFDQTSFRWLELPSLDRPLAQRGEEAPARISSNDKGLNRPTSPLEQLMLAMTKDSPQSRDMNPSAVPSKEWTTAQIEVKITR
jgi:hypothetical protein